jgi:outer membrane protein assembly factor BamB
MLYMGGMSIHRKIIVIGIIILFVFSTIHPIVFSSSVGISDKKEKISSSYHNDGPMDSAWPMFHHDVRHTGRSPYGKYGNWRIEKWKTGIGGFVISSPAIDKDGIIYIGSYDWYLMAVYPNGTEKWRFWTEGGVSSSPAIAADGTIYVGSNDGNLYAIYPNGTLKWSFRAGGEIDWVRSSPAISNDGTIYFGVVGPWDIGRFYSVNPNGTENWHYDTGDWIYSSPALDNEGTIYIGSHDNYLYALYPNGTLKWAFGTGDCVKSPPSIGNDGTIYVCSWDHYLYAINPDGTEKWRFDTGDAAETSPAIAADGTIYVGSYNGKVFSISPSGSENWRFQTGNWVLSSPVIDKYGTIYVGSLDGNLYALNPDGTLRWKYKTLDEITPSPAIGEDGTIYVGAHSYSFYAYLYAIEPIIYNNAPEKPSIDGPRKGNINTNYTYSAVTTDADGDNVSYYFDWGDGSNSGWTSYVPSGTSVNLFHSWQKSGFYIIKVKAKDDYEKESDWGTLIVKMPKNKTVNFNFLLLKQLEKFPNAFPLSRQLLRLK